MDRVEEADERIAEKQLELQKKKERAKSDCEDAQELWVFCYHYHEPYY